MLSGKQAYFTAAAEYHQSFVAETKGKYGEAVSRLQVRTSTCLLFFEDYSKLHGILVPKDNLS